MYQVTLQSGQIVQRNAWTGGDTPPKRFNNPIFKELQSIFFRESLAICGGLDLWKCAGTGSIERARIFWNAARLDAWRTGKRNQLF